MSSIKNPTFKKSVLSLLILGYTSSYACTTILVGKKASADGSVLVARNVDGGLQNQPANFIHHGASDSYLFHARLTDWTYNMPAGMAYSGLPQWTEESDSQVQPGSDATKSYEEVGFNSDGVSMSATETIFSNGKDLALDPQNGKITEDVLVTIVLPQIHSAKNGVEVLGKLIDQYGSAEGFGVAFADSKEIWYLENAGGHQWAAVRIPDDSYFVSANQSRIGVIDTKDTANVMTSANLIQFAINNALIQGPVLLDGKFDFFDAYSEDTGEKDFNYNGYRIHALNDLYTTSRGSFNAVNDNSDRQPNPFPIMFTKPAHLLSVTDVEHGLQNYYNGSPHFDPYTYQNPNSKFRPISVFRAVQSHVLQLRDVSPKLLPEIANVEYLDFGMTALGIYVPFYQGATLNSDSPYAITAKYQADNKSAWWKFKKLQTLVMLDFPTYAPLVQKEYAKLNEDIIAQQKAFEQSYTGNQAALDKFTQNTIDEVMKKTDDLTNQIFTQLSLKIVNTYSFHGA